MKKSDLKTGYIVTQRNGSEKVVFLGIDTIDRGQLDCIVNENTSNWQNLDTFNDDLTSKFISYFDIMKVEKPFHPYCLQNLNRRYSFASKTRELLWERDSVKEMTVADVEALVGCKVKIVKES